jgi:predicted SnoaL-like aldol condensation-catalyzing enzyme
MAAVMLAIGCARSTGLGEGDEDTRRAALRFYDVVNEVMRSGDTTAFDAVLAPQAVDHDPTPGMAPGREGIKRAFAELRAAYPDYRVAVEYVLAKRNEAACRVVGRMTHEGRPITLRGIDILHFERGLLTDRWGQFQSLPE